MMMTKRGVTVIAVAALAFSAAPAFAKGGWVVRICRGFTEASAIKISVGKPGGKDQLLVNWQSDNRHTDFPVHGKLMTATQLHVLADSEPGDGKVAMCVLYKGAATKAMNFTDLLEVTAAQKDTDAACKCPKSGGQ
jgi:hypothetical protein